MPAGERVPLNVIKKLGKFDVIEKVGQGAMGVVYKARDPGIGRIVALKTLTSGFAEDPNLLRRFYTEAQSAGGMQHPNIVTIYDLGQEGNTPFIAMQFLSGESLDKKIDRRLRMPLSQKIGFIVHVCRALEYAHKQVPPVIHRDIKPGNVMVTDEGAVVVVDFGIARLGEGTRSQSSGMLIGTLGYMSPQLFRNSAADARSDIWATGVMFYELLVYRRPFEGDNAAALMSSIILEKPRSLLEAAPGTPPDVQAVVDRMLTKEIESRYQTMEEVLLELEPIWQRLRQLDVSELLADSQQLFEAGDLENAKAKVIQIRQIDPSNTLAKTLSEKINAEARRLHLAPQLKVRLVKAETLLAMGQVEDAKAEVEAVLGLDSTFLPARELRSQVQAAEERARKIAQALRDAKQSMAEGALTEAQLHLDKILELDPGNTAARDQLRLIKEERLRRERRKQRDETLHRARTLWTNLQYEECIKLLGETLKQFPNDAEFSKLLESARQDQAEQHRQFLLAEARNLLSSQRLDEAVHTLDRMLQRFPNDLTAKNLRTHAVQGREQQIREQRLTEAKSMLRSWVKQAKYEDVIKHATQFSREFSDDFELTELIDFARTELAHVEQKRRQDQLSKQIQRALKEGRFSEARLAAEKALAEFPSNFELQNLLDHARKEQVEKEKHEALKQRLREIKGLIDRQELTDAIRVGNETLRVFGPDPQVADTLLKAEKELEFREKKNLQQDEAIRQARTLVDAGKMSDATSILGFAINTQLLRSDDPRVTQLLEEIDAQKRPPSAAAAAAGAGVSSPPLPGSPISSKPSSDPGRDYVYQRGTPLPPDVISPERDVAPSALSPTIITGPSAQPVPPHAPVVPPISHKPEKKKRRQGISPAAGLASQTEAVPPVPSPSESPSQLFVPTDEPAVLPAPAPMPIWKQPLPMAMTGLAAVLALASVAYVIVKPNHTNRDNERTSRVSPVEAPAPMPSAPESPPVTLTPTPKTSPPEQPEPSSVLVKGRVTDSTGAVSQANVTITDTSGHARYALTDGLGRYEIKGVPPGNYAMSVKAEGHSSAEQKKAISNSSAAQIDFRLDRAPTNAASASHPPRIPEQKSTEETGKTNPPPELGTSNPTLEAATPIAPSSSPSAPAKPPVQPEPVRSNVEEEMKIRELFTVSLSKVFDDRNADELKALWPEIDSVTLGSYRNAFEEKSLPSLSRKYAVASVNVTGDSATANGIWTGVHMRDGRLRQNDQVKWNATLSKIGGVWRIKKLQ